MHGGAANRALARDAPLEYLAGMHPSIAYYITSHGYGHGVRSCSIIRAINRLYPDLTVHIITQLPQGFISSQAGSARNPIRAESFDVGMVQLDSIRVDIEATLAKIEDIGNRRPELVKQESGFLRDKGIRAVVADIPGIPIEAAARVGIPSIAVGNFGWDWIYSDYVARDLRWNSAIDMFREQYARAGLLLRLPFCEEMKAFPRIEDIPLVAAPGTSRRSEIAALTGCDERKKWYLLSFTTLDWSEETLARVEDILDCEFITVLPLEWHRRNIHAISRKQMTFSDVIASADAVISKPGYGILSDCIVNRKPLIYADRSDFREYPILEAAIRRYMKYEHIPAEKLYAGDLEESLNAIWTRPEPEMELKAGGDRIAAERIAGFI
jgi:hypothetical protein